MTEHVRWPQPVWEPKGEDGADKPRKLSDTTPIDTTETTVRVLEYMEKNKCVTLGDMRQKITKGKLLTDGLTARSALYREILKLFNDTGSELRDASSDNVN